MTKYHSITIKTPLQDTLKKYENLTELLRDTLTLEIENWRAKHAAKMLDIFCSFQGLNGPKQGTFGAPKSMK